MAGPEREITHGYDDRIKKLEIISTLPVEYCTVLPVLVVTMWRLYIPCNPENKVSDRHCRRGTTRRPLKGFDFSKNLKVATISANNAVSKQSPSVPAGLQASFEIL